VSALTLPQHLAQTAAFIAENPATITLTRETKGSDGQGGTATTGTTAIAAQTMRKVGSSRLRDVSDITTPDGRRVIPTAMLIGMPDANIQLWDTFTLGGEDWLVIGKNLDPPWRVECAITQEDQ